MSTSCLSLCPRLFFIKWTAMLMFKYTCPTWPLTSSRQHGSQLEMHSALHENSRSSRTTGLRWILIQGMRVWLSPLPWSDFHYLWHLVSAHEYDDWAVSTEKPSGRGKLRPFPGRLRATAERSFEAGHAGPHTDQWEQSTTTSSSGLGLHQEGCA